MYCTQNLGHKIGGAVFMSKLTKKDKIEIYKRNKNEDILTNKKYERSCLKTIKL